MEVHFAPELQNKVDQLANQSGCAPEKILEDAVAVYVEEFEATRKTLDSRYDDLKSGRVKPIDGEDFFENLRKREEVLLSKR